MPEPSLNELLCRVEEMFPGQGPLCGETVVLLVAEARGLTSKLLPKAATGFCSGLARTTGVCGALTGAVLAVSMLTGRERPAFSEESNLDLGDCYRRVQMVVNGFEGEFGSRDCAALCGCDLSTDEGRAAFTEHKAIRLCRGFVRGAIRLALEATEDMD